MRQRIIGKLGFAAALLAAASIAHAEPPPTGKLPDSAQPLSYGLDLRVDPHAARFSGSARIRMRLAEPADHLWLHARDLDVRHVDVVDAAGRKHAATFAVRDPSGVAEVGFGTTLPAQDVEVQFEFDAAFSRKLQGAYKVEVGGDAYVVTQFEAISARYAFPGFDEPRFKTPFDLTLTVPVDEVAVANSLPQSQQVSSDGKWKTIRYARTPPLPTYLVAFAVGPWDVVEAAPIAANAVRRQPLPLRALGPRGTGAQLKWILAQTPAIVKYFEEYTAQPFPFDKLDLLGAPDFSAGAMENAGLIVFRDALLRIDATSAAGMERRSFDVTAHEIAHQWFGDLVTVPWWNDIWLNEAFATWAQGKATVALKPEYLGELGRLEGTFNAMGNDSLLSARRVRQPVADQGDIETAFDGITYQKGAAVLRMVEEWVGEDTYRAAMRAYLQRHRSGSGSSEDLIADIARVSGKGDALAQVMHDFLDQPGIPLLHTDLKCQAGKATLDVAQSRDLPFGVLSDDHQRWHVPLCVRFDRGDASAEQCFLVDRPAQSFAVAGGCADWYLPNANARGYYRFSMPDAQFAVLERRLGKLEPQAQMIVAESIKGAFARGEIGPAVVLDALAPLARSDEPQVAFALTGNLYWLREHVADDATRPALDAYAARLFEPKLHELGYAHRPGESNATSRLRQRVVEFLALQMRDPRVRRELDALGRKALGLDGGGIDLGRVEPDLRGYALRVTVQDSGAPAFAAALAALKSDHATQERYELVSALGATRDPQLAQKARALALTADVAVGEMSMLFYAQVAEPENRDAFRAWYQAHFDAIRARYPDAYQRSLPRFPAIGRCAARDAEELRTWLSPRIAGVIGGQRALAQSLETVTQCAALRTHLGTRTLARWVEAQAAP